MDNTYILTPSGTFMSESELYHHGTKGMKWGVRRYQNPDGSLTAAGRKRYTNSDGSLNEKGKKKFGNSVEIAETTKTSSKSSSEEPASTTMTDAELQTRVNRLRNEDAYRDLSKKLGYDTPKTELDIQIADMEKQKKYLELKRDIKKLTAETKEVSAGKKFVDGLVKKVIEPAATEAGKKLLTQYLTEAGTKALGKTAKKETEKIKKTVDESTERVKQKQAKEEAKKSEKIAKQEAKQQAKAEAKAEKQAAKQQAKTESQDTKTYTGTVEGEGTSKSSIKNDSKKGPVYDAEYYTESQSSTPVTSLTTTHNISYGSSTVSSYNTTPISGLLPAPKDDDD